MFSTSRAKPKKFCACLLTQPSPPGIGQKGDLPDVGSRESGGMLTSGRATRPPCSSMEKMLTAPDIPFLCFFNLQQSKGAFFKELSTSSFSFFRCDVYQKCTGQVILPAFEEKKRRMIYGLRALIIPPPLPRTPSSNTISSTIRPCDELY